MSKLVQIQKVHVFEWYDGWVAALVESPNQTFAACLVAFDPDRNRRIYALASIPRQSVDKLKEIYDREGLCENLASFWYEAVAVANALFVTDVEAEAGKVLQLEDATENEREKTQIYRLPCIEIAVSEDAQRYWFTSDHFKDQAK